MLRWKIALGADVTFLGPLQAFLRHLQTWAAAVQALICSLPFPEAADSSCRCP